MSSDTNIPNGCIRNRGSLYASVYLAAEEIESDADKGKYWHMIMKYIFTGNEPEHGHPFRRDFIHAKPSLDKILAKVDCGREGGLKGGKASGKCKARFGNQNAKVTQSNAKHTQTKRKADVRCKMLDEGCKKEDVRGESMPSPARAGEPPTLEAVLAWASQAVNHPDGKTYPVDWAKEWYETMRTADPPWTNVRGESVLPNWKNAMTWAWKRHMKFDNENKGKGEMPVGMVLHQKGYDASKLGI